MKSAGRRVPINGTHFEVLRSELGVPFRMLPSLRHHLTLRLTVSGPAGPRPVWPYSIVSSHGGTVTVAPPDQRPDRPGHAVGQSDRDDLHGLAGEHPVEPVRRLA